MSSFSLVIDEGDRSVSCDVQQYSKYGYITHHWLCCLHAKYHHTKLRHTVIMNIWNVDAQQRQKDPTWTGLCYVMSVSRKLFYLLVSLMLLSQDRVTIILTVKFKINNTAFAIKGSFEGQSIWNFDWIIPLHYAINICILFECVLDDCYLAKDLLAYNQAKFHHLTTCWRDIVFRIWCLPSNSYWRKWP